MIGHRPDIMLDGNGVSHIVVGRAYPVQTYDNNVDYVESDVSLCEGCPNPTWQTVSSDTSVTCLECLAQALWMRSAPPLNFIGTISGRMSWSG